MAEFSSPRFVGIATLRQCLNGVRTMPPQNGALPEPDSVAAKSVQRALVDLGYLLDFTGVDGIYLTGTANAVHRFKADREISPSDGVVGPKTSKALDEAFPPGSLPQGPFAPFGPRLDGTVAGLLNELKGSSLPWPSQVGNFALQELANDNLAGIVRASRVVDLQPFVPASEHATMASIAAAVLAGTGLSATGGMTTSFSDGGRLRGHIIINDAVLDRAGAGDERHVGGLLVLAHELNHFKNRVLIAQLRADPVTQDNYVDPAFASNALFGPPQNMRTLFIAEVAARHSAWKVYQDLVATTAEAQFAAGIIRSRAAVNALRITLQPGQLFRAVHAFGLREVQPGQAYADTGYMANLNPGPFNEQVARWMLSASNFSFHDVQAIDDSTKAAIINEFNFVAPAFNPNTAFPIAGVISF